MEVRVTFLGEVPEPNPQWLAQPQALNQSFARTQAEARAAFVAAWNEQTGDEKTEADFSWVQDGGPAEE